MATRERERGRLLSGLSLLHTLMEREKMRTSS